MMKMFILRWILQFNMFIIYSPFFSFLIFHLTFFTSFLNFILHFIFHFIFRFIFHFIFILFFYFGLIILNMKHTVWKNSQSFWSKVSANLSVGHDVSRWHTWGRGMRSSQEFSFASTCYQWWRRRKWNFEKHLFWFRYVRDNLTGPLLLWLWLR